MLASSCVSSLTPFTEPPFSVSPIRQNGLSLQCCFAHMDKEVRRVQIDKFVFSLIPLVTENHKTLLWGGKWVSGYCQCFNVHLKPCDDQMYPKLMIPNLTHVFIGCKNNTMKTHFPCSVELTDDTALAVEYVHYKVHQALK